jgi:hypothetical protein
METKFPWLLLIFVAGWWIYGIYSINGHDWFGYIALLMFVILIGQGLPKWFSEREIAEIDIIKHFTLQGDRSEALIDVLAEKGLVTKEEVLKRIEKVEEKRQHRK